MAFELDVPARSTDTTRLRSGAALTLRFATPADAEPLQRYFRELSGASRYSRLMGAAPELPATQLAEFVRFGAGGAYTVLGAVASDGGTCIVGELRYAYHRDEAAVEFGISVADRWQGQGIGGVLLKALECQAAALGATELYGDTLRSNQALIGLARRGGYLLRHSPSDWKQIRLIKPVGDLPPSSRCASWCAAMASAVAAGGELR